MKITFVGHESKGTWVIRAKQIAPYINAKLDANFTNDNCDIIILIKKPEQKILEKIIKSNIPIIWDIQDCWPQTLNKNLGNAPREEFLKYFEDLLGNIRPNVVLATSTQMKKDIENFGYESVIINHHHRKSISINPLREKLQVVGIEGSPFQIGTWEKKLNRICNSLNLKFRANLNTAVDKLAKFDVVINIRDNTGYAARYWKSNIKLANAHGSGTPAVCSREQSYLDNATGYEKWADTVDEIVAAIDELRPYEIRKEIHENFLKNKISLDDIGKEYQKMIEMFGSKYK